MTQPTDSGHVLDRVRTICLALPEAHEESAWVGTRWMIGKRNFAQLVTIASGRPAAYARAAGTDGPATVVTFRCPLDEVAAFRHAGSPFFVPPWFPNIVGMVIGDHADWREIEELLTESYCGLAPKSLAAMVARRASPPDRPSGRARYSSYWSG